MQIESSGYSPKVLEQTFNARWMSPGTVARTFVPIPEFNELAHDGHAVLLGPRGCGKTTMLKMLTRPALHVWDSERKPLLREQPFNYPAFEAIYIPSDVRWSYEMRRIDAVLDPELAESTQRALISLSFLEAYVETLLKNIGVTDSEQTDLSSALIRLLDLKSTAPAFLDLRLTLSKHLLGISSALRSGDPNRLKDILNLLPHPLTASGVDLPIQCCSLASDVVQSASIPDHWALCFDELEIAPDWLRNELFESLRSTNQRIYLKLTWSPLLPTGVSSFPQVGHDFNPIRLWHSHVNDARTFCRELTQMFLDRHLPGTGATPESFLSRSPDIHEQRESDGTYDRESDFHVAAKKLAAVDPSFAKLLIKHGLDPEDPYTESIDLRDKFVRKIAPLVLLRDAFATTSRLRSRKSLTVYSGETAVYWASEANPRLLLGLLNAIYDRWQARKTYGGLTKTPVADRSVQAKVLRNSASTFASYLGSLAWDSGLASPTSAKPSLLRLVRRIADSIKYEMLKRSPLPLDPVGAFIIERDTHRAIASAMDRLLLLGAIINIGEADRQVPNTVFGQRFRLSFVLAPKYKLPMRNYRAILLSRLLDGNIDSKAEDSEVPTDQGQGRLFK